ncbi:MAG: hypothetical protein EOP52_07105 [Sphingobacteriales bacterium]|nr:MAG: hypothetical protein EOP52_07105 [Sphingobacteriales bacterium]
MGFGFGLFVVFILLPFTGLLLILWLATRRKFFGQIVGSLWLAVIGLIALLYALHWLTDKTELEQSDYYGSYVIDRSFFPGKQADWQYNHFRFEIKSNDSIYFYVTDQAQVRQTYQGAISTTRNYISARLKLQMEQPSHHILQSDPTTYRSAWSFYLVFNSPRFNSVYFKKGTWKPISN